MITQQEQLDLTFLNFILCADIMRDYLDELKETNVYKQSTKKLINQLSEDLESRLSVDLKKIYARDEVTVVNCSNSFKRLIENIAKLSADDIHAVSSIIQSFKDNREEFLSKNEIVFKELDV